MKKELEWDEILKLEKKVSNVVHILSYLMEKVELMQAESQGIKAELMGVETRQRRAIS